MDEEKKAALAAADQQVTDAEKALTDAKAAEEKAKEAKDDAKIKEAADAVKGAEDAVTAAKAAKTELEAGDVDDLVNDATKKPTLRDGTPVKKDIVLAHDKFQDLNEKAKLFEQFAPLLAKIKNDPATLERLMANDDPTQTVAERIARLEQAQVAGKRAEVETVIKNAVKTWPDFRSRWDEIKPILVGLEAQGLPYADAVQRAYFAVNPDAVKDGKRLVEIERARGAENRRGAMPPAGGGGAPPAESSAEEYSMNDADRDFAAKAGVDPKLYTKHRDWVERFKDL